MELMRVDDYALDFETGDLHESPEEFLLNLEEKLDSGEWSLDEAINYLTDIGVTK